MKASIQRFAPEREYYFEEGCHILELSNTEGDPPVSIARARVPPGVTTKHHRLHGIVERYLILEGEATVEVGGLGQEPVGPGDVVLIPAGCPQRITNRGTGDLTFLAICTPRFTPRAYEALEEAGPGHPA
jgi:mannose-6-phosphate isomerase-like protein (cupin superfamily)